MLPAEEELWETVGVNDMSDEEDSEEGFLHKTPANRSAELRVLTRALDDRHREKQQKENRPHMKVKRITDL